MKRIVGRVTASASIVPFFCDFANGFANCAGTIRSLCPMACSLRASHCDPGHASMPTRLGAARAKNERTVSRRNCHALNDGTELVEPDDVKQVLPEIDPIGQNLDRPADGVGHDRVRKGRWRHRVGAKLALPRPELVGHPGPLNSQAASYSRDLPAAPPMTSAARRGTDQPTAGAPSRWMQVGARQHVSPGQSPTSGGDPDRQPPGPAWSSL